MVTETRQACRGFEGMDERDKSRRVFGEMNFKYIGGPMARVRD